MVNITPLNTCSSFQAGRLGVGSTPPVLVTTLLLTTMSVSVMVLSPTFLVAK